MKYDFDKIIERKGTGAIKTDVLKERYGREDLTALWVADMDFPTVPQVVDAIVERAKHPIYGYTENAKAEKEAEVGWIQLAGSVETHDTDLCSIEERKIDILEDHPIVMRQDLAHPVHRKNYLLVCHM